MIRYILAIIGFILFSCPYSLMAQTNPVPDITGWKIINMSRIELRISGCASVYLGFETEYGNPTNESDFVRVVSRHIPVPISKCKKYNQRLLSETVATTYNQKEEQDLLTERSKQSDPFLYIQWQTAEDSRTGGDVLTGDVSVWFMPADGNWIITKNEKIAREFLTENIGNGKPHNIFSGVESRIGDKYHLIRVSRDYIIQLLSKEDGDEN